VKFRVYAKFLPELFKDLKTDHAALNIDLEKGSTWEMAAELAIKIPKVIKADKKKGTNGINRVAFLLAPEKTTQENVMRILPTRLSPERMPVRPRLRLDHQHPGAAAE